MTAKLDNLQATCLVMRTGSPSPSGDIFLRRMKAHLMFSSMTPATSQAIAGWLRETEKPVFQSALASLAAQRM